MAAHYVSFGVLFLGQGQFQGGDPDDAASHLVTSSSTWLDLGLEEKA